MGRKTKLPPEERRQLEEERPVTLRESKENDPITFWLSIISAITGITALSLSIAKLLL